MRTTRADGTRERSERAGALRRTRRMPPPQCTGPGERGGSRRALLDDQGEPASERAQILDQVRLLRRREPELQESVVVVDHVAERGEPAVVVVAALPVREEPVERGGAVAPVRRALRLEVVD